MKLSSFTTPIPALLVISLLAGCVTQPPPPPPPPTSASVPIPLPAMATAPAVEGSKTDVVPMPEIPMSTEVTEFVAHFTQPEGGEAPTHQMADTTSFPAAMASLQPGARAPKFEHTETSRSQPPPEGLTADGNSTQLVVRDWTGLVLVPISTSLSVAHTSAVRLLKVEAHPLSDGRVRIWVRVQNIGKQDFSSEVACAFRMRTEGPASSSPYFYELDVPARGYRDVFFVSPEGKLSNYTVLVRAPR